MIITAYRQIKKSAFTIKYSATPVLRDTAARLTRPSGAASLAAVAAVQYALRWLKVPTPPLFSVFFGMQQRSCRMPAAVKYEVPVPQSGGRFDPLIVLPTSLNTQRLMRAK